MFRFLWTPRTCMLLRNYIQQLVSLRVVVWMRTLLCPNDRLKIRHIIINPDKVCLTCESLLSRCWQPKYPHTHRAPKHTHSPNTPWQRARSLAIRIGLKMRERIGRRASLLLSPSATIAPINRFVRYVRPDQSRCGTTTIRPTASAFALGNFKCTQFADSIGSDVGVVVVFAVDGYCGAATRRLAHLCTRHRRRLWHQFNDVCCSSSLQTRTKTRTTINTTSKSSTHLPSRVGGIVCVGCVVNGDSGDILAAPPVYIYDPPTTTTKRINSDDGIHHGLCLFQR